MENVGPFGTRVLFDYLRERGQSARVWSQPLTGLPKDAATVVMAGSTRQEITREEQESLEAFVKRGGRLLYFAPREGDSARMREWLQYQWGALLPLDERADDPLGSTAALAPALGLSAVRVQADVGLDVKDATVVAGAQHRCAVAVRNLGRGSVWIFAGADIAENRRLDLLDNLALLERLTSGGPVVVGEHHLAALAGGRWVTAGLFTAAQLSLVALLLFLAGRRLGPPVAAPVTPIPGAAAALRARGRLFSRARVDRSLLDALLGRSAEAILLRWGVDIRSAGVSLRWSAGWDRS